MANAWDDDIAILSSENVSFAIETAGLASRFAAAGIDFALQLLLTLLLTIVTGYAAFGISHLGSGAAWLESVGSALLIALYFLIWYGYYFLFEWLMNGQTPGKKALGLRVVETNGLPLTLWPAFARNMLRIVDFLPLFYGLGTLTAIANGHNRRIGDIAAGTVVARERRESGQKLIMNIDAAADAFLASLSAPSKVSLTTQAIADAAVDAGGASAQTLSHLKTVIVGQAGAGERNAEAAALAMRLDQQDWELLNGFLMRRAKMAKQARARLAGNLSARLSAKLNMARPAANDEEAWLESVARMAAREE